MSASNIDQFNQVTGAIFAHLYQNFPNPIRIDSTLIGIEITGIQFYDPVNEVGQGGFYALSKSEQDKVVLIQNTAIWLARSGFIRYASTGWYGLDDVTLTLEGLELLKAIPKSLGPSLGDQLIEAAKTGVTGKLKDLTSELISKAVILGVKAATDYATS